MNGIFISIGGNLGERLQNLSTARKFISQDIGKIEKASQVYQTQAWGKKDQNDFLNQVLKISTKQCAAKCIELCLSIEKKMGRVRKEKWEARLIDIDILFFNKEIIQQKKLIVPHPEIQNRKFVLVPLAEIAAHYIHPLLRKKVATLLQNCSDPSFVEIFKN